jgi:hypothetical protein
MGWDKVTEMKWLPVCVGLVLLFGPLVAYRAMVFVAWWFGVPLSRD